MSVISDFLSKFLSSNKDDSVLGLDIGSSAIKAVQLRRKKGKAVLETYGELSLGPYGNVEVGRAVRLDSPIIVAAIKDLYSIKEVNITTKSTGVAIPMKSSMVSVLTFPTDDKRQLGEMVPLEARKYIPVPISEVVLDWSIIPDAFSGVDPETSNKPTARKSNVLVVAIHNDVIANYQQICKDAELKNSVFEIELFSVMRAILDQGQVAPVLIIDIGSSSTKAYVIEAGTVHESHTINRGSQDITLNIATSLGVPIEMAEQLKRNFGANKPNDDKHIGDVAGLVLDHIWSEINSVIVSYGRRYNKNIGQVYLTGGGSAMKGVAERSQAALSIKTEVGSSFGKIQVPAFLEQVLRTSGTGFSVAAGIALRKLQELE